MTLFDNNYRDHMDDRPQLLSSSQFNDKLIIECADPQLKLEKVKLHTDEGKMEIISSSQRVSDWLNELEGEGRDNNKANPDVIFHLLKAINGNTESLGYVIDQIREDESNIYQFLGHLVDSNVETRDAKVLNEKVIK